MQVKQGPMGILRRPGRKPSDGAKVVTFRSPLLSPQEEKQPKEGAPPHPAMTRRREGSQGKRIALPGGPEPPTQSELEIIATEERKEPFLPARAPSGVEERFARIADAYRARGGDSDFLAHFLYDPSPDERRALLDRYVGDTRALSACQTIWHTHGAPAGPELAKLVRAARQAMPETAKGQASRLARASPVALCAAAEAPISESVYAYARWTQVSVSVDRCLEIASLALGNIPSGALARWWLRLWNAELAPIASRTVALRADRQGRAATGGPHEAVRASWLPPSGGGPDEVGDARLFVGEAFGHLVRATRQGSVDPLAVLYALAYPAACVACPCELSTVLLGACRAGILAPLPQEKRNGARDEAWYVAVGGEESEADHTGGTVAGVAMEGIQTVIYVPASHIAPEEYAVVDGEGGCTVRWRDVEDADGGILIGSLDEDNINVGSAKELARSFATTTLVVLGRTYVDLSNGVQNDYEVRWAEAFPALASGSVAHAARTTIDDRRADVAERAGRLVSTEGWWFDEGEPQSLLVRVCGLHIASSLRPDIGLARRIEDYVGVCGGLVRQHTATALVYPVLLMAIFMSADVDLVLGGIERTGRSVVSDEVLDELAGQAANLRDALARVTSDVTEDAHARRQTAMQFLSYTVDVLSA